MTIGFSHGKPDIADGAWEDAQMSFATPMPGERRFTSMRGRTITLWKSSPIPEAGNDPEAGNKKLRVLQSFSLLLSEVPRFRNN